MVNTKIHAATFLFCVFLFLSLKAAAQVKILENQIGIGTQTPAAAIDIRSVSNFDASRFQVGNLTATSKIQLLSGKKGDERSFLLFSPQDTFILAQHFTDTSEVMRLSPDGSMEIQGAISALGDFKLQRAKNDNSIYIGFGTGTTVNGNFSMDNVFIGPYSGQNNQTGNRNTFIGSQTGLSNQEGSFNTFIGNEAGRSNENGIDNTALGTKAGESNISGSENIFLGNQAGNGNLSGNTNIFIGRNSGIRSQTGSLNTFIGLFSGSSGDSDLEKAIAIGTSAEVGCSSCAVIGGSGENAVNLGLGVPVPTAKLDVDGTVRIRNLPPGTGDLVVADTAGNLFSAPAAALTSNKKTEALEAENQVLRTELKAIKERLNQLEDMVRDLALRQEGPLSFKEAEKVPITGIFLGQNQPNPFRESTLIKYFIPQSVNDASLQFTDIKGVLVKSIAIDSRGKGETILQAFTFTAGTYFYSLILDGEIVETKKMVLTSN